MIKKVVLAFVAVIILTVLAYLVLGPPEEEVPVQRPEPSKPAPWNGLLQRHYGIEFVDRGESLTLDVVDFKKMKFSQAEVVLNFETPITNNRTPAWFKPKKPSQAFRAYRAGSGQQFTPANIDYGSDGTVALAQVTFTDIPVNSLGPTCQNPMNYFRDPDPFIVEMPSYPGSRPGDPISLIIRAPSAPSGHCLLEPEAERKRLQNIRAQKKKRMQQKRKMIQKKKQQSAKKKKNKK